MPLSATAAGRVSLGTCSLTEDCQAGPNSAMPLPTTKQSASSRLGCSSPRQVSTVSVGAPGHLGDRPGRADALDQDAEIGEQAREPDAPEDRVAERCGDAVGGKGR